MYKSVHEVCIRINALYADDKSLFTYINISYEWLYAFKNGIVRIQLKIELHMLFEIAQMSGELRLPMSVW